MHFLRTLQVVQGVESGSKFCAQFMHTIFVQQLAQRPSPWENETRSERADEILARPTSNFVTKMVSKICAHLTHFTLKLFSILVGLSLIHI